MSKIATAVCVEPIGPVLPLLDDGHLQTLRDEIDFERVKLEITQSGGVGIATLGYYTACNAKFIGFLGNYIIPIGLSLAALSFTETIYFWWKARNFKRATATELNLLYKPLFYSISLRNRVAWLIEKRGYLYKYEVKLILDLADVPILHRIPFLGSILGRSTHSQIPTSKLLERCSESEQSPFTSGDVFICKYIDTSTPFRSKISRRTLLSGANTPLE